MRTKQHAKHQILRARHNQQALGQPLIRDVGSQKGQRSDQDEEKRSAQEIDPCIVLSDAGTLSAIGDSCVVANAE